MWYFNVILIVLCVISPRNCARRHNQITIATLLPADDSRLFSIRRVAPALSIAIGYVNRKGLLPRKELVVEYADTKCRVAEAMNEAINYFVRKRVNVFFGPCCDYPAAPIARQAPFWNIPMITPGAMARDFALMKRTMFPLLTRIGTDFNSLVTFIISVLQEFNWSKVKLLYDPLGQDDVVGRFCHIAADGIHYGLRNQRTIQNLSQEYFKFDVISDILDNFASEVGLNIGGK
ncbi:hypothetical protein SNE40_014811 [Patella caerulea]|uniref:Receptor ligand binding region domain-containing protein n=1 Tax=Patella caerulea TaxID=87958 RepID=A0AAN8PJQ4_PATCE